ncbi:hypothetical protein NDU88_010468 [Pleurodeles waltl]|uniref:Uncharacterized protein n=1 Tax=Pleurodeles waltl TaxID=8319 RepID=A0AAV7S3E4_PLEWA|nr:hypothetical protein NDU88_010468 [Pleurodeles waltl]
MDWASDLPLAELIADGLRGLTLVCSGLKGQEEGRGAAVGWDARAAAQRCVGGTSKWAQPCLKTWCGVVLTGIGSGSETLYERVDPPAWFEETGRYLFSLRASAGFKALFYESSLQNCYVR